MIVIRKNGAVYFCESAYNSHYLSTMDDFTKYAENRHTIKNSALPHRLIMVDAPARVADLLRYSDIFPARLTPQNLLKRTYPELLSILEPYGFLNDDGTYDFDFAFAKDDKCYMLRGGGMIDEVEEFYPMCFAKDAAIAEYIKSKDEPIYRLVQRIYKSIERGSMKIQFPVVVMNTKNDEVRVINREEEI